MQTPRKSPPISGNTRNRFCIYAVMHGCALCRSNGAEILAHRISTSLLRRPLERRMTPAREGMSRLYFLASYNRSYGCLRVCLPSCRARTTAARVLHSRLEPIPCRDTYAIGFLPQVSGMTRCMPVCTYVSACVRVRTSMEIAMIFEAFSVAWQRPRCLSVRHNFCRLSFIHQLKRARTTWRECKT